MWLVETNSFIIIVWGSKFNPCKFELLSYALQVIGGIPTEVLALTEFIVELANKAHS